MLSTMHRRRDYQAGHKNCVAKFMLHFDGLYTIIDARTDFSTYTLDISLLNVFPTFHVSLLHKFVPNDPDLFPSCEFLEPGPILTSDGLEEHFIDHIVEE